MGVEGWRCPFLIRLLSIETPPGMMCYVQDFLKFIQTKNQHIISEIRKEFNFLQPNFWLLLVQ